MSGYILAAAAIILVCLLLSKLSGRMGVPTLALFILLGMLVGSDRMPENRTWICALWPNGAPNADLTRPRTPG